MREGTGIKLAFALCLINVSSVLFYSSPLAAQSDARTTLVNDIAAYLHQCKRPVSSAPTLSPQECANQKAALMSRQGALHLSDAETNKLLNSKILTLRGGPRPVWP